MVLTRRHRIKLAIAAVLALVALAGETDWGRRLRDPEAFWARELQRREWELHHARIALTAIRADRLDAEGTARTDLAATEAAARQTVEVLERSVAEARQKAGRGK